MEFFNVLLVGKAERCQMEGGVFNDLVVTRNRKVNHGHHLRLRRERDIEVG